MNENASADYKTVRGLSRGLLLLNLLNKFDGGATVGTLAEFSGLHRTTVRRLLETLQDEGYVRRSRSDDSFRLTIKVRQLSEGHPRQPRHRSLHRARPAMRRDIG